MEEISLTWPRPGSVRTIACANQKGGVGKSTSAVNIGACLALEGARVLLVDLDPQANATTGVGLDPRRVSGSIYHILVDDRPAEDAIEATAIRNLFCIPSTIDLAGAEIELVPVFSRELKLRRALESVVSDFDYVWVDCPPSLGLLTVNALSAVEEVIVPIQCEYYALEGLGQLMKNVKLVQSSLNSNLRLSGVILTMYDSRTKLAEAVAQEVRGHFGSTVFRTVIPRSVRLSEAPSYGQPIALYDARSKGAVAYRDLSYEIALAGVGASGPSTDNQTQPAHGWEGPAVARSAEAPGDAPTATPGPNGEAKADAGAVDRFGVASAVREHVKGEPDDD